MSLIDECLTILEDNSGMLKPTVVAARAELDELRHDSTVLASLRQIIVRDPTNQWITALALQVAEAEVNGIEQALETQGETAG